jgi:hypothetical protein
MGAREPHFAEKASNAIPSEKTYRIQGIVAVTHLRQIFPLRCRDRSLGDAEHRERDAGQLSSHLDAVGRKCDGHTGCPTYRYGRHQRLDLD